MLRKLRVVLVIVVAFTSLTAGSAAPAAVTPRTALVYGDSLTFESRQAVAREMALHAGWTVVTRAVPGTAVCDWIPSLATDLATYHPSIVAIETVGNTRPCMVDANGVQLVAGTAAFFAKITADLSTMFRMITATGARAEFVKGPPMLKSGWNSSVKTINANAVVLAKSLHQVSVTGTPRSVVAATGDVYTAYKACLPNEPAAVGCASGRIAIRTLTGTQAGVHFCPDGLQGSPYSCDVYSSGEYRFGRALARALVNPPAPLNP